MSAPTSARKGSDKKKLFGLLGLVAIGLLLWGRLLVQQVPRTVVAGPANQPVAVAPEATPSDGTATPTTTERKTVRVDMPANLPRDLFAIDPARYVQIAKDEPTARPVEKSVIKTPDTNTAPQASGLVLQTTILGDHPRAVISGQVLMPGQKINGYVLKKVLPRKAVLEMNGIELHLEM